jgi:hypothetical protein
MRVALRFSFVVARRPDVDFGPKTLKEQGGGGEIPENVNVAKSMVCKIETIFVQILWQIYLHNPKSCSTFALAKPLKRQSALKHQ